MNDAVTPATGVAKWLLVISAITGTMVFEFTWTIAGVALPHMQGAFSATADQIAWVMTAFVMGSSVMIACIGWLSDKFGRKKMFALSIIGFTITLVMCATSTTLLEESIWRFVQGATGAGLIPLGQAITVDAFPSHKASQATALWGNGVVLGAVMGPVIGGIVVENYSWQWIFWLNVPVGVIALVGVIWFIPEIDTEPDRPMDWFGLLTLVAGLAAMQLMLNRGERQDWFESREIILEFSIMVLAFYLFITHSWTARNPFFRAALFKDRNFLVSMFFCIINGALAILPLVLMPLVLQNVGGYPAITAGGLIIFRGIGLIIGMTIVARITDWVDQRYILATGLLLMCISGWAMSRWTVDMSAWEVMWTNTLQGMASGFVFVTITTLAFSTLSSRLRTEGFAVIYTILFTGSALGVAGIVTIHSRSLQINYAHMVEKLTPFRGVFDYAFMPEEWDISKIDGLAALQQEILLQANMIAYNNTFFFIAALSLLFIPFVFLFKKS